MVVQSLVCRRKVLIIYHTILSFGFSGTSMATPAVAGVAAMV